MPQALELVVGFATAPGATLTALTMASGSSATVKNGTPGKKIGLLSSWAFNQVAGTSRIRSPRLHDPNQGIRYQITANMVSPKTPMQVLQPLIPQDNLTLELSGSAVGGQIETQCTLIYYEDLPGISGRFIDRATLISKGVNEEVAEVVNAFGAAGGFSGEVAINSSFDNLKANTDYAVVGAVVKTQCAAVTFRAPDTGGLRIGVPGEPTLHHVTSNWFVRLSDQYGLPLIPVVNAANKGSWLCDGAQNQAGTSVTTGWCLVELAK